MKAGEDTLRGMVAWEAAAAQANAASSSTAAPLFVAATG